ncbi:MAG TPA: hypothetical protein VK957_19920 [Lunatimonas sp.]|nr:hypothetical protein [Lunatimonas sp.]
MSKIHLIYEPDAQPVVPTLDEVLDELKRSKNISDFNRLRKQEIFPQKYR